VSEIRSTVLYCPFCAGEDLHPVEQHGGWECRSCLRVFSVKVLGLSPQVAALAGHSDPGSSS
jgi:ribosomal protein L37AE/L43A